jgi:hypothetical protein
MKATFQANLEKAKKATKDAKGAMTAAASKMFTFYSNLLSPKCKYAWNKIVVEKTESNPYVNLQGVFLEGPMGNVLQVIRQLCGLPSAHRVSHQHGRARKVLHYKCS